MAGVRQFDEERMLDQALAVFWQHGYSNTTMQELASATGVQRGSLYNAYGDKETLFLRVFERYHRYWVESARRVLDVPDARDALDGFLDLLIDSLTNETPARSCMSTKTAMGPDIEDPVIRGALNHLLDELEALFARRLAAASGQLRLPPHDAARLFITATRGLVVIERLYQDKVRLRQTADILLDALFGPAD
ncbi:TetR/AcrR family transcriptional regulator [Bordetella hinzii]|uniref:TetR/AcrR family transcriptional regulator n=2 Tax=Bordetella hinzii TaxID=103855 RepID=A0AAN1VH20_9BORD|nr:TetR/AcrR family transcriptional regulator [Bordetella hinzii]AKQ56287.1 HTH-type transcriptional repressor ComR [Bordetella hinzii]AKQ60818.1 HTH-type transcriptional repressor ComR [Bordetella hinzii]AZW18163.1 TetR/AcrR family transcriptional regulator [Bordetella hinzii]KCB21282.1 transcriptional regulator, TetR family [Bordetella hinzii OH87 BAL007II]KCB26826.1 transcriptional regulator, TetR family [Bordetella hinzii L60]